MKILVLQGSPNRNGSTYMMANKFIEGAKSVGHDVELVQLADLDISPCTGCIACGYEGDCVQADDMEDLLERILASDMLVFATPLYYFGVTAQMKAVIDRFCSKNSSLGEKGLKTALLTVGFDTDDWTFDALIAHYQAIVRYRTFQDMGMVLGYGCGSPSMTARSKHLQEAYDLGASL